MKNLNNPWRITASTIYKKPEDSKIFGSVEIDITELNKYIEKQRKNGIKITLTHFFSLATGRAIAQAVPEFNTFIKRGKIYNHPGIDAAVSVLQQNGHMGSVILKNVDKLSFQQAVYQLNEEIQASRRGKEHDGTALKDVVAKVPWPIRGWLYSLIRKMIIDWGITIPGVGLNSSSFGSFVVSNIGSLGLDTGYPALMPVANMAFVLILGGVKEKPWVVDGKVVPRTIITLSTAIDHRVADANHGGLLFKFLKKMVKNPKLIEIPA